MDECKKLSNIEIESLLNEAFLLAGTGGDLRGKLCELLSADEGEG